MHALAHVLDVLRASDTIARPLSNTVARVGADEFVVLCEGIADERGSIAVADRIAEALEQPFELGAELLSTTASIGIALSDPAATPESLLRDADAARYRAQERGRARYELFDEALRVRVVDRRERERSLRQAIDCGELRLHYQPILSLADGSVVAAEALVRWEHPELGLLAPQAFIELAEESGLIVALGVWVLRESCRQIAAWERSFGPDLPLRVSVNVSARQLRVPNSPPRWKTRCVSPGRTRADWGWRSPRPSSWRTVRRRWPPSSGSSGSAPSCCSTTSGRGIRP